MDSLETPSVYSDFSFAMAMENEALPTVDEPYWCCPYMEDGSLAYDSGLESMHDSGSYMTDCGSFGNDSSNFIGNDPSNLIGNDASNFIGNDSSNFIQNDVVISEANCFNPYIPSSFTQGQDLPLPETYIQLQDFSPDFASYDQYDTAANTASYSSCDGFSGFGAADDLQINLDDLEFSDDEEIRPETFTLDDLNGELEHTETCDGSISSVSSANEPATHRLLCPSPNQESEYQHSHREFRRQPILSRFLLEALENPTEYSSMIKWVDKGKGIFQFSAKNKEELAKRWGEIKHNRCVMTYQKMSRALRIYIKKEKVVKKMKRKLHYVFREEYLQSELQRMARELRDRL